VFEIVPEPSSAHPVGSEPSSAWIEAGVGVLVLPLTCAIVVILAPLLWMLAPKARK
jgi:hypothetical protein